MKKILYLLIITLILGQHTAPSQAAGSTVPATRVTNSKTQPIKAEHMISFDKSNSITVPKGTFFKVINQRELSTATMDEGETVTFITSEPIYAGNYTIIPSDSIFIGQVEQIKEATEGVNALLKIKIVRVKTPTGDNIELSAYVWSEGNNFLGGTLTPAKYYKKTPHYIEGLRGGVLQYTPTSYRYVGTPTIVKPGTELFLILHQDLLYTPK